MKTRLLTNVGALMTLMNDSEVFCSYHVLITFTWQFFLHSLFLCNEFGFHFQFVSCGFWHPAGFANVFLVVKYLCYCCQKVYLISVEPCSFSFSGVRYFLTFPFSNKCARCGVNYQSSFSVSLACHVFVIFYILFLLP